MAIAATHGVYKSVNTKKLTAERGVNKAPRVNVRSEELEPVRTARVDTTASFAVKPVRSAVRLSSLKNQEV
jgi:hypothetical protein